MHKDLAQLDALAALPQRAFHALAAADDGHAADAAAELDAHVAVACLAGIEVLESKRVRGRRQVTNTPQIDASAGLDASATVACLAGIKAV